MTTDALARLREQRSYSFAGREDRQCVAVRLDDLDALLDIAEAAQAAEEREKALREALVRIEETCEAWAKRDAELGEDSTEWRLAAESRAGLILNFARAALESISDTQAGER